MNLPEQKQFKHDVLYYENFIPLEDCPKLISYFESMPEYWGDVAFYGSFGMGIKPNDPSLAEHGIDGMYFENLRDRFQAAVEESHGRPVKPNTSHAQKWETGAFANFHSDNSDFDGNPTAWEINKFVGILYLNNDYEGGMLEFRDHDLKIEPKMGMFITFPGGVDNIHGVTEITSGTRYTMVSFWDYKEAAYSDERQAEWEEEIAVVRVQQAEQKEQWLSGNKYA